MTELEQIEGILKEYRDILKEKYYVKRIGIFGSLSKGKQTSESDVDILVEFDGPIGWDIVELNDYLEELIGKKIDLVSIKALKPQLRENILNEVIYV
ncbi:MAG: nucleotidyltransferase [Candidatus Lokiarchaeota archaeon]|nr:nucleotidyltransferase [Candidatus Lokiarchaeota archaeon]